MSKTMAKTRKVITVETYQQICIRSRKSSCMVWCAACGKETLMLAPEHAALVSGASERLIFRQIENGELHFIETGAIGLLVCSNSLTSKAHAVPE